jgi:hypothetical protein
MTTHAQQTLPLPGLDQPSGRGVPELEVAVRRTLAALDHDGLVREVDAGKLQLALELAQVIDVKKRTGRASTIGNDARVLMEILNDFKEEASEVDTNLAAAMDEWREVVDGGRPEVRDST